MRKFNLWILAILILSSVSLLAQENLYISMTADEFRKTLPGVLPDGLIYNGDLRMQEKINSIDGKWTFRFDNNKLTFADFVGNNKIISKSDFVNWVESAELVIEEYTKIYGQPVNFEKGSNKYQNRNNREYKNKIGKREVFEEATWKTNTMRIKISCDFRSNYYEEFKENAPNDPDERYYYSFQINYSLLPDTKAVNFDEPGKFYIGMDVNVFKKVFPYLFPVGVNLNGQWYREQDLYDLKGNWSYTFKDGKLNWVHYQKYIGELDEKNFRVCLFATRQLINDFSIVYGKPDTIITGDTTNHISNLGRGHIGYGVMEARWNNYNGMKIYIEFNFTGGRGQQFYLVKIDYFDKNYPQYDYKFYD